MDVNEHKRICNFILYTKKKSIGIPHFTHSRVFNNEHNSYTKMNMKNLIK